MTAHEPGPAMKKWQDTTLAINIHFDHEWSEPEARAFLDAISRYIEFAREVIAEETQRGDRAEATIERLKVCGNCGGSGYHGGAFGCFKDADYLFFDTDPTDHCHLDPSRWSAPTERSEG